MYVLEIAAQNVRGFSPTVRVALKPGYNVLKPPAATLTPIAQLAQALCFSDGRGGDSSFLAPGAQAGKAGLTILGKDQITYRLLRELGGSGSLHRLNPANQKFELVSEDAAEIGQFLRSQVGLPSKNALDSVYCVLASQQPSRRPKKAPAMAAPFKPGGHGGAHGGHGGGHGDPHAAPPRTISRDIPVVAAEDVAAAEKRLFELQAELKTARETAAIQFEFDGLMSEIDNIERKIKMLDELKGRATEAENEWKSSPTPQSLNLPADLIKRAEKYSEAVAKRDSELARLKDAKDDDLDPIFSNQKRSVEPLWKDPRFWYGIGAGAAALLLGIVMKGSGKYIALLDIPAFGFAAVLAYKYVEELQSLSFDTRRGGRKQHREEQIKANYEAQAMAVDKAMDLLEVENPTELIAKLRLKDELQSKFNQVRAKVDEFEADALYQEGFAKLPGLKVELERVNGELQARGGYLREPREVEKDLDRLKQSISLARSGAPMKAVAVEQAAPASGPAIEDPCPAVLAVASDLLQTDMPGAIAIVRDRTLQYFAALTDKRYQALEFDLDGRGSVSSQGKSIPVGEMPPKDADLLHLSLKLTVAEKAAGKQKVPVFIEDGISCVDEIKVPLLARMLKHLGTLTQVIHVSAHPGFATNADSNVNG